jgi:branched-chain amino acid transport system substrate-binding protein
MSKITRFRGVPAIAAVAALLVVSACSSKTETSGGDTNTNTGTTVPDASALLGPPNAATGSEIKIGLIDDGKSEAIDHTPIIVAFNATVKYVNEHLGGINGHKITVDECQTNNTPSDATQCGIKMVNDKVAAALVPVSAQDGGVFDAMSGSGISYVTYAAGNQDIIAKPGAFLMVDPLATLAAPAKIAGDNGIKKAAVIIIDVPAATGPMEAISTPMYKKAGVDLSVIPISPQTADMTPQIQQAISDGNQQFTVVGTDEFNATGIKTLKQLGFTGKIVMVTAPSPAIVDAVPGGLDGVIYITSATSDPNDPDVKLYNAVMQTYAAGQSLDAQSAWAFALVMGFVNGIKHDPAAVDSASVTKALGSMPKPLPLPLGAGLLYQCGAKVVPLIPNTCTDNALWTTLDAQGQGQTYQKLDVSKYLS